MYDVIKENSVTKKEIEIRGRYMMMACDIEFAMLNIIMFCHPDPYNHKRAGQFKEMRMAAKINNVISDLKKYKPEYYNEFEGDLKKLDEFRQIRNDMSHCVGRFPNNPDLSVFRIDFIDFDEMGVERIKFKDYTEEFISDSISLFAKLNSRLFDLWMRLKTDFEENSKDNPFLRPSEIN